MYLPDAPQHIETLIVGHGVRVNELQWVEPQPPTNVGSVTVDALIAGNAAGNLREAMRKALTRRESALLALYRCTLSLADSLMLLHAAIKADAALPLAQNRYYPAAPKDIIDLATIQQVYTRSDTFAAELTVLEDSLVHLDRLVYVSLQVALSASPLLQVMNPTVEAVVAKLDLTNSVPNIALDYTKEFVDWSDDDFPYFNQGEPSQAQPSQLPPFTALQVQMLPNAPVFEPQSICPPVVTLHQQRVSVPSGIRSSQVAAPNTLQNGKNNRKKCRTLIPAQPTIHLQQILPQQNLPEESSSH
ncbi:hypothetical protein BDR26DRAFT_891403 [Obelidium mucronatum]|nr:hypothetical protein BDR26DRAFT_891403 [Obelidium mucronatum]